MVRRNSSTGGGGPSDNPSIAAGDVIWAPYRRTPEWPSIVRGLYPKKITYVFLPLPEDKGTRVPVFNCPISKVHLFSPEDTLPSGADNAMKEAFQAAMKLVKEKGQTAPPRQRITSSIGGSSKQKQSVKSPTGNGSGDKRSRSKNAMATEEEKGSTKRVLTSSEDDDERGTASTGKFTPAVNDIVWLTSTGHPAWPVLVRQATKKLVLVDSFPLTGKSERYPQSACEKFDLNDRSLSAAIKRERNPELKEALQSVQKYRLGGYEVGESSRKIQSKKDRVAAPEEKIERLKEDGDGIGREDAGSDGEEKMEIDDESADDKEHSSDDTETKQEKIVEASDTGFTGVNDVLNSSSLSTLAVAGSPSTTHSSPIIQRKRPIKDFSLPLKEKKTKFSEEMLDLEKELATKLENLRRGDVAWVKCGLEGINNKWPIVILGVDKTAKMCSYAQLPLEGEFEEMEEGASSAKLVDVFLYDTVQTDKDTISNELLKAAIEQADEIIEGKLDPLRVGKTASSDNKVQIKENGWENKDEKRRELKPAELLEQCISQNCRRHLLAIWLGTKPSERQAKYKRLASTPLRFEIDIGNLLPEADTSRLVDVLDGWVQEFQEPEKSVTRRLHYIASVVLPEALVYGITQVMQCSRVEASNIFEEAVAKDPPQDVDEANMLCNAPAPLQHLLRAVSMARSATLASE